MADLTAENLFAGLSLLVTVGGFIAAIWQIRKTKTAAESAEAAAKRAFSQMQRSGSVEDLTSACQNLEWARRLIRENLWDETLERFASVRQRLSNCHSRTGILSSANLSEIQSAITHLSGREERIEAFSLQGANTSPRRPAPV